MEKLSQLIKIYAQKNQKINQIGKIKKKVEKALEKVVPVAKDRKTVSAGVANQLKAALNPLYGKYDVHMYVYSPKCYTLQILMYNDVSKEITSIKTAIKLDVMINSDVVNDAIEAVNFYGLGLSYVHQMDFIDKYNQNLGCDKYDEDRDNKISYPELF
ncbi:MAG: hypothetical protein ACRBG0_27630 [Lewinella sp.]|uniref:hypothetical protein n=1 Tax=Lewinella sp. TaxID=2004506 RepID=UPI003D6A5E24